MTHASPQQTTAVYVREPQHINSLVHTSPPGATLPFPMGPLATPTTLPAATSLCPEMNSLSPHTLEPMSANMWQNT